MARPDLWLRPYMPGDFERFTPREDFRAEIVAGGLGWPAALSPARTWTLVRVGAAAEVCAVGGVTDVGDGAWVAWAVLGDLTAREICVAAPLAEDVLASVERFVRPPRIYATARETLPGAVALLAKLGFRTRRRVVEPRVGADVIYQLMTREAA